MQKYENAKNNLLPILMLSLLPPAFWCWNSIESKLWQYLEEADNVYPSSSIYFLRASEIISLAVFISSKDRFGVKSRSRSTDKRGKSKIVILIAVPPFKARCSCRYSSVFKYTSISFNRKTFSNVSRTKPLFFAACPSCRLS